MVAAFIDHECAEKYRNHLFTVEAVGKRGRVSADAAGRLFNEPAIRLRSLPRIE